MPKFRVRVKETTVTVREKVVDSENADRVYDDVSEEEWTEANGWERVPDECYSESLIMDEEEVQEP